MDSISKIKTFEDACDILRKDYPDLVSLFEKTRSNHSKWSLLILVNDLEGFNPNWDEPISWFGIN